MARAGLVPLPRPSRGFEASDNGGHPLRPVAWRAPIRPAGRAPALWPLLLAGLLPWLGWVVRRTFPTFRPPTPVSNPYAMAAAMAAIRSRLATVRKAKQVTGAMKLIAAARLRQAQELVAQARPFSEALQAVFANVLRQLPDIDTLDHPLLQTREVRHVTLVVVGADRGLCGNYNSVVLRRATARCAELQTAGYEVDVITVGDRITRWFQRRGTSYNLTASYPVTACAAHVSPLCGSLADAYAAGRTDAVELLYTRFIGLGKTEPATRSLLPFQPTAVTREEDEVWRLTARGGQFAIDRVPAPVNVAALMQSDVVFDQPPEQLLETMVPLFLDSQMARALQESVASELSTRLLSMRKAAESADELVDQLRQSYNRQRQAQITNQALEQGGHMNR
eukprot:EG_transcript_8448